MPGFPQISPTILQLSRKQISKVSYRKEREHLGFISWLAEPKMPRSCMVQGEDAGFSVQEKRTESFLALDQYESVVLKIKLMTSPQLRKKHCANITTVTFIILKLFMILSFDHTMINFLHHANKLWQALVGPSQNVRWNLSCCTELSV